MDSNYQHEIADSLRRLALAHSNAVAYFEETVSVLCRALHMDENGFQLPIHRTANPLPPPAVDPTIPTVDESLLSVVYRNRRCFLGNTLPLWFFKRLARQPNHYIPYRDLLKDVWDGQRSNEAVRSVAQVLKQKLKKARMGDVAKAIDGSNRGHFGLILDKMR
jgi:hypothetical protein